MSFLSLSALQAALLAAATLGAVLILFFLRLRHRRVVVGSALLWQKVLDNPQTNSLIEKLRRWLSLLLAIVIALLIALSVGRPYFTTAGDTLQPVAIIMDTSISMDVVTAAGRTRWEAALDEAERILSASPPEAGIMAADTAGRVQTPVTEDPAQIHDAIARMQPSAGSGRFPEIPASGRVYFITDGVAQPQDVPPDTTMVSVFEPVDNVAITAFEVQVDPTSPSGFTAYLEVANYSATAKETAIVVAGVGGQRVVRGANLAPGGAWREALDLDGFRGGGIQVRVQADGDRFEVDDVAFSYMPARGEVSVTLVTRSVDGYLETLLRLTPEIELTVASPEAFAESVSTDVYVFEGWAPAAAPARPSLLFGTTGAGWLPPILGVDTEVQVSAWDDEHPVMRFVPFYDLGIDSAAMVDSQGRNVIAASGETPLILIDDRDGQSRAVIVTFGLDDSDFAFHLAFPIFVENVLGWFSGETLAETRGLGQVELPAGTIDVRRLDGTPLETTTEGNRTLVELGEADLLTAVSDGRRIRVAASMTDPEASNINRSTLPDAGTDSTPLPAGGGELWFYMLLGAAALIALEWWTYNRRITL